MHNVNTLHKQSILPISARNAHNVMFTAKTCFSLHDFAIHLQYDMQWCNVAQYNLAMCQRLVQTNTHTELIDNDKH